MEFTDMQGLIKTIQIDGKGKVEDGIKKSVEESMWFMKGVDGKKVKVVKQDCKYKIPQCNLA